MKGQVETQTVTDKVSSQTVGGAVSYIFAQIAGNHNERLGDMRTLNAMPSNSNSAIHNTLGSSGRR
ncbi:MAG TPA: hypothetical protein DIC52_05535 [Candidatus Latescibacteria bacterium]|nr:hypothetical protein [Candidatus Latescibacterota bacterium]|tara:strand:+ start:418 stop:615 length:198 start_codon:yes stop_codon:yes gene_type:complete